MKKGIISREAYKRISTGHPWLTADDILDRKILPNRSGAFLLGDHWWLCSPKSFLRLRRLGPPLPGWMQTSRFNTISNADQFRAYFGDWMYQHLRETLKKKARMLDPHTEDLCLRWIFSENDQFPGLIVDIFGDIVVAQINSAPIELFWVHIRTALETIFKEERQTLSNELKSDPRSPQKSVIIKELRNSPVRKKEGLEIIEPEDDANASLHPLRWNGLSWLMTPLGSQKTGAYFDQRDNHRRAAEFALRYGSKTAWDLCAYQGGFGLHLLKAGLSVTAVDQSEAALEIAKQNVALNQLPQEKYFTHKADVFEWLRNQLKKNAKTDLIILDPPSFVKSRHEIASAQRGYKELNTLALQCLNPGGLLVSCVCSHHITLKLYKSILEEAASGAQKQIQILEQYGPSADHAAVPEFTEGHYLQAWLVRLEG